MSFVKSLGAALLLSSTAAAVSTTVAYPQPSQSCVSGAHIIIARASTESPGEGIIGGVADMVKKMVSNSDSVAVTYPATLTDYPFSEQEGVVGMKQLVTDYVSKCQNGKIVLMGYSQGAQVVGDTVIGSDEKSFSDSTTNPTGLGKQYLNNIVAMIMMGDPSFSTGVPGHVGNASQDGVFPRQNNDAFKQYGLDSKMQTYCDAGDEYCASGTGKTNLNIHLGYVQEYGSSAASFVASAFSSAGGSSQASATGGSSSSSSGGGSSSSSKAGSSSSSKATSASSAAKQTTAAAAAGSKTTSATTGDPLTSQRYQPFTGTHTGTFGQPGNLANVGGIHTMERGIAGTVFGAAMFVLGML